MVNRALLHAQNNNQHQIIPYGQAVGIAGAALAAIQWLPPQAREVLVQQTAQYIASTGGRAIQGLTRFLTDNLSGMVPDGFSLEQVQDSISNVANDLATAAQRAGTRARDMIEYAANDDFHTDEHRRIARHTRFDEQGNQITQTDGGGTHTRFAGKSFRNLPWRPHKPLRNRKQMKQQNKQQKRNELPMEEVLLTQQEEQVKQQSVFHQPSHMDFKILIQPYCQWSTGLVVPT